MDDLSSGPTAESPDFSTCRNCGGAIGWDDWSYTHMENGFSTCGTIISGGRKPRGLVGRVMKGLGLSGVVDPTITTNPDYAGKTAEPVEWGDPGCYPGRTV